MSERDKLIFGTLGRGYKNPTLFHAATEITHPLKSWAYDKAGEDPNAAAWKRRFDRRTFLDKTMGAVGGAVEGIGKASRYVAPVAAAYFGGPIGGMAYGALSGGMKGGWKGAVLGGAAGYGMGKGFSRFPGSYGYQSPASYIDPFKYGMGPAGAPAGPVSGYRPLPYGGSAAGAPSMSNGGSLLGRVFGAAGTSAGNGGWVSKVLGGVSAVDTLLQGQRSRREAERANEAMKKQRSETLDFASPENLLENYELYREAFDEAQLPYLRNIGEALALREQTERQDLDTAAARSGMFGSGMHTARHGAIGAGRTANYNEALREAYWRSMTGAMDQAGDTTRRQTGASMGAPYYYTPGGPSGAEVGTDAIINYLASAAESAYRMGLPIGSIFGAQGGQPTDPYFVGPYQPYYYGEGPGRG